jgi:hypothetical protein
MIHKDTIIKKAIKVYKKAEEEDSGNTNKPKGPPARWKEFLKEKYESGKKKVTNTNPDTKDQFPQVTMLTLFNNDSQFKAKVMKEYESWIKDSKQTDLFYDSKPKTQDKPKQNKPLLPYKDLSKEIRNHINMGTKTKFKVSGDLKLHQIPIKYGNFTKQSVFGLIGGSVLRNFKGDCDIAVFESEMGSNYYEIHANFLEDSMDNMEDCQRIIFISAKEKYIKMVHLSLTYDAPKGLGTKILAQTVANAIKMGFNKLTCEAERNDTDGYVGYKVWPKMGYDGPLPTWVMEDLPDRIKKDFEALEITKPTLLDLYELEDGPEWWEDNGATIDLEFDLSPNSRSLHVFYNYLKNKADKAGDSLNDYVND